MYIIDLDVGVVSESELLPLPGSDGCAASDGDYVYWVRGTVWDLEADDLIYTKQVYRAKGKHQWSRCTKAVAQSCW